MIPFTKQESRAAVFLALVILSGAAIGYARKQSAVLRPVFCFDRSYGRVNINTADTELLKELPGIGNTLARRIIDYRSVNGPFADIDALRRVKGLNGSRFERLKEAVCVE